MKKLFSKVPTWSILFELVCVALFFAPFLYLKGNVTSTNVEYVSGFQLILGNANAVLGQAELGYVNIAYTVLGTLIFIGLALVFNLLGYKKPALSFLSGLLEWAGAVCTFAIVPFSTWGYNIPANYTVYVHVGSMLCASFLVISGFVSFVNGLTSFRKSNEVKN